MNTIKFNKITPTEKDHILIKDFRKYDVEKIKTITTEMMKKLSEIREDFNYNLSIRNADSQYKGGFSNRMEKLCLDLSLGKFVNKIELEYPKLMHDNCFIINGSIYVPMLFLERSPIDRIKNDKQKKNKLLLNLLCEQFLFDFKAKTVRIKNTTLGISEFMTAVFNNPAYDEFLQQVYQDFDKPIINNRQLTIKDCVKKVLDALGIIGHDRFEKMSIADFFDKYIILDYEKEILNQFYGVSSFRDIIRICYTYFKNDFEIDIADIRNRRIVMMEYLMYPIFLFYNRIVYNFIDSTYKEHLIPSLKNNTLMSDGFRERMKGEQLFNVTLPYITPAIHKVSQHIVIISNKVPKKWTANHLSAMGILCPISVSAQDMGSHLMTTQETELTIHGKIKSFAMPNEDDIRFKLDPIEITEPDYPYSNKRIIEKRGDNYVDLSTGEIIQSLDESPEILDADEIISDSVRVNFEEDDDRFEEIQKSELDGMQQLDENLSQ